MAEKLLAALEQADREGWKWVGNEAPSAGERVEVMHIANRSYDCEGECDEHGAWSCGNAFILPNMVLTFAPTHWRAKAKEAA